MSTNFGDVCVAVTIFYRALIQQSYADQDTLIGFLFVCSSVCPSQAVLYQNGLTDYCQTALSLTLSDITTLNYPICRM